MSIRITDTIPTAYPMIHCEDVMTSRTYGIAISVEELKRLQAAHLDGRFPHTIKSTITNMLDGEWPVTVDITTDNPQQMCRNLQDIVDACETSWNEILGIGDDYC